MYLFDDSMLLLLKALLSVENTCKLPFKSRNNRVPYTCNTKEENPWGSRKNIYTFLPKIQIFTIRNSTTKYPALDAEALVGPAIAGYQILNPPLL